MTLDPSSPIGMIRLRIADWSDIPILSDAIIQSALTQNDNNVPRAAKLCAQYVLGSLTNKVHRKMSLQLEVFGSEWYQNYRDFLVLTVTNPAFMDVSPLPSSTTLSESVNPLVQFSKDWNNNFFRGTNSQELALDADIGPNDGSRYGPLGSNTTHTADGTLVNGDWTIL